jgi:ssDNA-binding Zn-finger/Zn-ribbon topoisomerase 1
MILKEKDPLNSTDPRIKAGFDAERQMAHYLQRAFGKDAECYVLNDLRIELDGDFAQIDHLVVTRFGFFIIESKAGGIVVTKRGDWERQFDGRSMGMQSPVNQAEEQGRILRGLLQENRESLRSKYFFGKLQGGFQAALVEVLVAVSDKGTIRAEIEVPELDKSDNIPKRIRSRLDELTEKAKILSLKNLFSTEVFWEMPAHDVEAVARFLVAEHKPQKQDAPSISEKSFQPRTEEIVVKSPADLRNGFVPRAGAKCPKCATGKLVRRSIARSDGTETDFLCCSEYPQSCKALFPLVALPVNQDVPEQSSSTSPVSDVNLNEGDACPKCKTGRLKRRQAKDKPSFLGCSNYPKCRFTDYKMAAAMKTQDRVD